MAMSKKVAGKAANGKTKTVAAVASPAKKKPAKKAYSGPYGAGDHASAAPLISLISYRGFVD